MFDFSWTEIFVVLVVALVVVGPKDIPEVTKSIARVLKWMKSTLNEIKASLGSVLDDADISQSADNMLWKSTKTTSITDLDGKQQVAFDIDQVQEDLGVNMRPKSKPKKNTPVPVKKKAVAKKSAKKAKSAK